ncbi:unnamed protein product [Notodromas monacha]|uniref:Very long-chain fatty acid transport protein n=1 Tax=Notodromas monacha TaxID=399045 RepID=A0A7R9BI15_9CRUS|nr:unnamed protein product [Notodromas monacha]CAG0915877.1 unnamed protein product [Notodromas monacha]
MSRSGPSGLLPCCFSGSVEPDAESEMDSKTNADNNGELGLVVKKRSKLSCMAKTVGRDVKAGICFVKVLLKVKLCQRSNTTVPDLFIKNAKAFPNKLAVIAEGKKWTFKDLDEYSNQVANYFQAQGYKKGDVVALFMDNSPEFIGMWLGLAKVGVVPALVNINLRLIQLVHCIKIAESKAVVFHSNFSEAFGEVEADLGSKFPKFVVRIDGEDKKAAGNFVDLLSEMKDASNSEPVVKEQLGFHDKLVYIYTSGTTGMPKAAVIKHSRFVTSSWFVHDICRVGSEDVVYAPLPMFHSVGGILGVGQCVLDGNTLVTRKRFSASGFWSDCVAHRCTVRPPRDAIPPNSHVGYKFFFYVFRSTNGSHFGLFVYLASAVQYMTQLSSEDIIYDPLPLYHTAGGMVGVGQMLGFGLTVVVRKKFSASQFWTEAKNNNCTVAQYIGEICRYLLSTPEKPDDRAHKVRVMFGNGLRPQIWEAFQKRFGVERICEFYGSTEGNANIINMEGKVGAVGFKSLIVPSVLPILLIKVDEETGEPLRGPDGLCIPCEPGEPGEFIGKIQRNHPLRDFDGYADEQATKKKIMKDVFKQGDLYFRSGDVLVMDEFGYFYFRDRTGDTFRWRGENVSTSEVEGVLSHLLDHKDCVVYGVEVPLVEGRAGMAAILDPDDSVDLKDLVVGMRKALAPYARPVFIRKVRQLDSTGTYKLKKLDLQHEAFDMERVQDPLFFMDPSTGSYVPLDAALYDTILSGKTRL